MVPCTVTEAGEEYAGESATLTGLAPEVSAATRLLVLGSFPSVASLAAQQYYAHPRNQFWRIVGALCGQPLQTWPYDQRITFVRQRGLGIWDVYASCRRPGSLDADIRHAVPNDLAALASGLPRLVAIAHNGGESARSLRVTRALGVPVFRLPSSSPANASWSFERKLAAWQDAFESSGISAL